MAGLFPSTGLVMIGKVSDGPRDGWFDVRVDRQTIFGNKFPISETGSRTKSCDLYDAWAEEQMRKKGKYWSRVQKYRKMHRQGINLLLRCHCWPKRCHAQTIKRLIMRVQ